VNNASILWCQASANRLGRKDAVNNLVHAPCN
jgi:hypothetical protein